MSPWRNLFRCERRTKNCTSDCKTAIVINKKRSQKSLLWTPAFACIIQDFVPFVPFFRAKKRIRRLGVAGAKMMDDTEQTTKAKWQTAWNHTNCGLLKQANQHLIRWKLSSDCKQLMQGMPTLDHRHWSTWSLMASGFKILNSENVNWKPKKIKLSTKLSSWVISLHVLHEFARCDLQTLQAFESPCPDPAPRSPTKIPPSERSQSGMCLQRYQLMSLVHERPELRWHWDSSFEKGATSKISHLVASVKSRGCCVETWVA